MACVPNSYEILLRSLVTSDVAKSVLGSFLFFLFFFLWYGMDAISNVAFLLYIGKVLLYWTCYNRSKFEATGVLNFYVFRFLDFYSYFYFFIVFFFFSSLKLVDKFTYLGSSISSTETDIDTQLTKAWTAINRLSVIWKSDLTDKIKPSFFQAAIVSILLYGCTTWTLTKQIEKKLDGNYTRIPRAILNKSWRQHP